MALKNTDIAAEYPFIFMLEQSIHQSRIANDTSEPKYTLSLAWTYYRVETDGSLTYAPNAVSTYFDDNFHGHALMDYLSGDMTHMQTLGAQQLSVQKIVESETGITLEVV